MHEFESNGPNPETSKFEISDALTIRPQDQTARADITWTPCDHFGEASAQHQSDVCVGVPA
jgi:hypothetical protein